MRVEELDYTSFVDRASRWLSQHEGENCLLLGLLNELRTREIADPFFALVTDERELQLATLMTPPEKLVLSKARSSRAVQELANNLAGRDINLPGVVGAKSDSELFAKLWSENRGVKIKPGLEMSIYCLQQLQEVQYAQGNLKHCRVQDIDLCHRWAIQFAKEVGIDSTRLKLYVEEGIRKEQLFFWQVEAEPVSMVGWSGKTPNGVRISLVFTPNQHKNRGFATSLVARLSTELLKQHKFCFLFADQKNQAANRVYQKLGFNRLSTTWMENYFV